TIDPLMAEHGGRVFKTTGDGLLAEFPSAVQALRCAIAIQERQRANPDALTLRIGLHSGDVVVEGDDLLGDGVNIAARIEPLAEPGGIALSARIREDAAGKLDLAFEDLGTPALKNIAQPVQVFRIRPAAPERPALALPEKPSLVVLPFQNMSGDPEQEYFVDGLVEDITTALSRTGWLFVIGRNSAFTYKGRAVDLRQVGRELGVRYVLEGSVRRAGGRVRITGQLIEAAGGGHIWADRFDGELADIFDLQDRITESVVGAIEPSLRQAEIARSTAKPTNSLDAYDLYWRAQPLYYSLTKSGMDAAVTLLSRSVAIDPGFARARGFLSQVRAMRVVQGFGEPGDREASLALARETLAAPGNDPEALRWCAGAIQYFLGDHAAALATLNRAMQLHANSSQILGWMGHAHNQANDPQPAVALFERAMRLSPLDSELGFMLSGLGHAYLLMGRNSEALPHYRRSIQEAPNFVSSHKGLIIALVRLDALDEARAAAARLLDIHPDTRAIITHSEHYYSPAFRQEARDALMAAGIPA
ncbi:MAG: tetratricopeptide repeat protein, partial [Alphaproteobacteria bacterium]|nr:tetratricopeptide repeat protein [Alphaproteobacteria bacterium]